MNPEHLELLQSDGWRDLLHDFIVPFAFGDLPFDALGNDVLEIGPGPGRTTDILRAQIPVLTALEIDPNLARELADRIGDRVDVIEGDATAMPFESGRFSAVVSFTMLHHVPTVDLQDRLFAEAARVLRPDSLFVASDSVASSELAALHDDDTYNPIDPATLEGRLLHAGFRRVAVRHNDFGWAAQAGR